MFEDNPGPEAVVVLMLIALRQEKPEIQVVIQYGNESTVRVLGPW